MTDDDRHNDPAARLERACLSRISSPVIPGPAWCRPLACADPRARRVAESPRPDTGVTHAFPYGATSDEGDGRSRGPAQRDQQVYRPVHRAGRRSSASMGSISCRSYGRFKTSMPTAVRDASTNEVERRFHAHVPPTSPTREARTTSTCHCRRRRTGRPTTSGLTRKLVHCARSAPRWNAGSCSRRDEAALAWDQASAACGELDPLARGSTISAHSRVRSRGSFSHSRVVGTMSDSGCFAPGAGGDRERRGRRPLHTHAPFRASDEHVLPVAFPGGETGTGNAVFECGAVG